MNVAQWKKYANALRMRYAMRISDVNPQKAKEEFEKAVAAGAIASAADDAYIKYAEMCIRDSLFVDDNEDLRQYIRMAFADQYHVVDVESGEAALKLSLIHISIPYL